MNVHQIRSRITVLLHGNWLLAIPLVLAATVVGWQAHEDDVGGDDVSPSSVVDQGQNPDEELNSLRSAHHGDRHDASKRTILPSQVSDGDEEEAGRGPQSRVQNRLPSHEKPVYSERSYRQHRSYSETSPQQLEDDSSDADHHVDEFLDHLLSLCDEHATTCASQSSEPLHGQSSIGHGGNDSLGGRPLSPVQPDAGIMDGHAADARHTDRERRSRSSDNRSNLMEVGVPDGDAHRHHGGHEHRLSPATVTIDTIRRAIYAFRSDMMMEQRQSRQSSGSARDFAERENPGRIWNSPLGDGRWVHDPQGSRRQ